MLDSSSGLHHMMQKYPEIFNIFGLRFEVVTTTNWLFYNTIDGIYFFNYSVHNTYSLALLGNKIPAFISIYHLLFIGWQFPTLLFFNLALNTQFMVFKELFQFVKFWRT